MVFRLVSALVVIVLTMGLIGCADAGQSSGGGAAVPTAAPTLPPLAATPVAAAEIPPAEATPSPIPSPTSVPSPTPTATPTLTPTPLPPLIVTPLGDGQFEYRYPLDGLAFKLPDSWSVADLAGFQAGEPAAALSGTGQLDELFNSDLFRDLIAGGVILYALNTADPSLTSPNPANVNVTIQMVAEGSTLEGILVEKLGLIQDTFPLAEEDIAADSIQVSGLPAIRLVFSAPVTNPLGESFALVVRQYFFLRGSELVTLTANLNDQIAAVLAPEIDAIVAEIEVESLD